MGKIKSGSTIALDKTQQKKVKNQVKKLTKKVKEGIISKPKEAKRELKQKAEERRGLLYISHIPHGFYEEEMREYFKQFGRVTNVKVCRSSKTGNSKGYGYVEFSVPQVAKIAAESMNNYLMFKKRMIAEYVPYEKRPKHLFHGKSSTPSSVSVINRRKRQIAAKNSRDSETLIQKSKSKLNRLKSKLERLQKAGIKCNIKPVGAPENTEFVPDEVDSDIEFKFPNNKSSTSSKKLLLGKRSTKAVLTKSLDSVKTLLTGKPSKEIKDEEVQTKPIKIGSRRGISKKYKDKKKAPMNSETVKKIAQELIRKKGDSLLNVIGKPMKGKKKNKK